MAGENATDESRSGEERLKVAMFIPVIPVDCAASGTIQ
jgi:hypothetical protein